MDAEAWFIKSPAHKCAGQSLVTDCLAPDGFNRRAAFQRANGAPDKSTLMYRASWKSPFNESRGRAVMVSLWLV